MTTIAAQVTATDPGEPGDSIRPRSYASARPSATQGTSRAPSIADQYSGLLDDLTASQRRGLIAKLANGYYDGWRPTRAQLIRHLWNEYGVIPRDNPGSPR